MLPVKRPEPAQSLLEEYAVVASQVFVRAAPSLNAEKVGKLQQGAVVAGQAFGGWLCLDAAAREKSQLPAGQAAFVLIDGTQFSLGKLLEFRRVRPPCGAFSKDVYTGTLEYRALRQLTVCERPSEDSKKLGVLDPGKPAVGYPMGDWFELKDNWGWVQIVREGLEVLEPSGKAFCAYVQGKFAEGLLFDWNSIPGHNVSYDVEWVVTSSGEWEDVEEDEISRETGVRQTNMHIRSLAPTTRVLFRVFANVMVESSEPDKDSPLVGIWEYGSKPTRYRVLKLPDGRLKFDGPHSGAGRVSGVLEPAGPYIQADVCSPQGERIGTIRLRYLADENAIISNWRNVNQDDWGKDIRARKGATERVLTRFSSNELEEYTGFPISDKEEQDCRYDPLSNLRGGCQRSQCSGFIAQPSLECNSLERCLCRRCGCPCTQHELVEEYITKEKPTSSFAICTRTWSLEDLSPGEDAVLFLIAQIEAAENLYETLGVPHTADAGEVRRVFRNISLRLHPDKLVSRAAREPELVEKAEIFFKLLSAASEVLGDERRRRDYDLQWKAELQRARKEEMRDQKVQQRREQRERMARRAAREAEMEEAEEDFGLAGEMGRGLFGRGGALGQSGLFKQHVGGGFTWQFVGGGSITVDHTDHFASRGQMPERMPDDWGALGMQIHAARMANGVQTSMNGQAPPFDPPYRRM